MNINKKINNTIIDAIYYATIAATIETTRMEVTNGTWIPTFDSTTDVTASTRIATIETTRI